MNLQKRSFHYRDMEVIKKITTTYKKRLQTSPFSSFVLSVSS